MGLGKSQDMNNGGGFAQQNKVHICGVVLCFQWHDKRVYLPLHPCTINAIGPISLSALGSLNVTLLVLFTGV